MKCGNQKTENGKRITEQMKTDGFVFFNIRKGRIFEIIETENLFFSEAGKKRKRSTEMIK